MQRKSRTIREGTKQSHTIKNQNMKIGIFGCGYRPDKLPLLQRLFEKLNRLEAEIFVSKDFHAFLTTTPHFCPPISGVLTVAPFDLDVALSVGGDGTFLRAAEQIGRQDIPILGINTGRLGFLAEAGPEQIEETLDELFRGDYRIERRMMLRLQTRGADGLTRSEIYSETPSDSEVPSSNYALNEETITRDIRTVAMPCFVRVYATNLLGWITAFLVGVFLSEPLPEELFSGFVLVLLDVDLLLLTGSPYRFRPCSLQHLSQCSWLTGTSCSQCT